MQEQLPACRWRGNLNEGKYGCKSTRLVFTENGVAPEFCAKLCPYVDHEVNFSPNLDRPTPCVHKGEPTGERLVCASCSGKVSLKVFECTKHARCLAGQDLDGLTGCQSCTDYAAATPVLDLGPRITRAFSARLAAASDGRQFNGSVMDYRGKRLLCYRTDFCGARLHLAELDSDLQPTRTVYLDLHHPRCAAGCEDPRLFILDDRLHVQFAGVEWSEGKIRVNVLYARLFDSFEVEDLVEPQFTGRTWTEKNWGPFDYNGDLHFVYTIRPHQILRVADDGMAEIAATSAGPPSWLPSETFRGGAAPVRHGDEFYSFFHTWSRSGSWRTEWYEYAIGLYTFSPRPPFQVLRFVPAPILRGDRSAFRENVTHDKSVVFPGGAVFDRGQWIVSYGHHDAFQEFATFSAEKIEAALKPIEVRHGP